MGNSIMTTFDFFCDCHIIFLYLQNVSVTYTQPPCASAFNVSLFLYVLTKKRHLDHSIGISGL